MKRTFKITEIVYWLSYLFVFIELRTQDYETYTTQGGAGWGQILFMMTSGILFYYCYSKKWINIILALLMMLVIIASTGVRSLIFYIIIPIGFYYLYLYMHVYKKISRFILKFIPLLFLFVVVSIIVDTLRFGSFDLPETELTEIALNCMQVWNHDLQYGNSIMHYIFGLLQPINNALLKLDIHVLEIIKNLYPSIPKLNALIYAGTDDLSSIGAYHMPATIFYNFYMSWGKFACVMAFFTYLFFIQIFKLLQSNIYRIMFFSPILGWHIYMVLRGASDTGAMGVAYSLWLGLILYFFIEKKQITQKV